jgi:hypothetical protein
MKTEHTKQLKIKLKDSDADNFKSAIKKIADENKAIGFKKSNLNEDEIKVIQQLSDKVNGL